MYVAGGVVGSSTTDRAACYDPKTNTWTDLAPMPRGRNRAAAGTDGKRLFVFGGRGAGSGGDGALADGFDTVQVYNPATNQWFSSAVAGSALKPLPQGRAGAGRAGVLQGRVLHPRRRNPDRRRSDGATADGVYGRGRRLQPGEKHLARKVCR